MTFGYKGMRSGEDLVARVSPLLVPGDRIFDVRLNAWSGVRAFSLATRRTVEDAGFAYTHIPDLGNAEYKTGGMRIRDLDSIVAVEAHIAAGLPVGIMCACPFVADCHRRLLADELVRRRPNLAVYHLDLGKVSAATIADEIGKAGT